MRVICPHYLSKALITSSNRLSDQVIDLYCQCTNTAKCGASFVSTLAYKHMLNPPMRTVSEMAMGLVNRLSKEEKSVLQRDMLR
jgi:cell division protein ZapA